LFHHSPLPWVAPGTLAFAVVGVFASVPLARALRTLRAVAWLLVVSLALIVFATLVPLYGVFEASPTGSVGCDLSVMTPATLADFLAHDDRSKNVLLFIPLGCAIGLLPRSRRSLGLILGGIALPFAIEATQGLLPMLHRACQSNDVIDNITGLLVGLAVGAVARAVFQSLADRTDASPTRA
jgi:hypothetical protein